MRRPPCSGFGNSKRRDQAARPILDRLQRRRRAPNDVAEMIELRDIGIDRCRVDMLGLDRLVPVLRTACPAPIARGLETPMRRDGPSGGSCSVR